ncbi:hypothetical protein DIURU_000849 [Diutina rugosa]|uniref:Vacuolar protein sorting-associated protein 26 n=1 Tax=Diutina rugosa TaxID=5481 RepID=A0A642UXC4_DIURU|nr:uncharacterized protein DIURU_000849 [Diutina rugosa]KAA8907165.1 hypothetical protein DIURU_000849 [Diutina rugosa]
MSLFFKSPLDIEIRLDDDGHRQYTEIKSSVSGRVDKLPVYKDGESVKGTVTIRTREGRRVEHTGVKVQLMGSIEINTDGVSTSDFLTMGKELAVPGIIDHEVSYPFEFKNVEKQYESYRGKNAKLRYYVKVVVSRKSSQELTREKELWVFQYLQPPPPTDDRALTSVKMDVGIEECLHIEFEYSKSRFNLKDVIHGRIYFQLVRLKIRHMELRLVRREEVGTAPNQITDIETLVRYEIMDGAPVKGETIPIRLYLSGFDLSPTYSDVNKRFSSRTFLSLVLIDEDARRYFKQSEIILYRD